MKKRSAHKAGNLTAVSKNESVTPVYETFPLTAYKKEVKNGTQKLTLPEENVIRLREFDIENKK